MGNVGIDIKYPSLAQTDHGQGGPDGIGQQSHQARVTVHLQGDLGPRRQIHQEIVGQAAQRCRLRHDVGGFDFRTVDHQPGAEGQGRDGVDIIGNPIPSGLRHGEGVVCPVDRDVGGQRLGVGQSHVGSGHEDRERRALGAGGIGVGGGDIGSGGTSGAGRAGWAGGCSRLCATFQTALPPIM